MQKSPFLSMMIHLRKDETVLLYGKISTIGESEQTEVVQFLEREYRDESSGYPFSPPSFEPSAAIWAAQTVYIIAQLLLYRDDPAKDLEALLPDYQGPVTAEAILSADLCLRFIPDILDELKLIDDEDSLIELIQQLLKKWHYSGMSALETPEQLDFAVIQSNECLQMLYCNRVIEQKHTLFYENTFLKQHIDAALGLYKNQFWNELTTHE
jgi:hypothetical protein